MGKKIKGCKRRKNDFFFEILRFWQFQKIVFDYYNTILHYSDDNYTIFILYGVENQTIFQPGGEGNQRPGGEEIKGR